MVALKAECEAERQRARDDKEMEIMLMQMEINRLERGIADLHVQLRHLQNERPQGGNGQRQ